MSDVQMWVGSALMVFGALLSVSAGIGVHRFPDAISRMHATSKPQTVSITLFLVALTIMVPSTGTILMAGIALVFLLLTSPVGAHMLARSAYRQQAFDRTRLDNDQLAIAIDMATKLEEETEARVVAEYEERNRKRGKSPGATDKTSE